jgi:hypothetical protein
MIRGGGEAAYLAPLKAASLTPVGAGLTHARPTVWGCLDCPSEEA